MENKNKLKYVVIFLLLGVVVYFVISGNLKNQKDSPYRKATKPELQYVQDSKEEFSTNPFIEHLPYQSGNYDIYFDSTKNEIKVILKSKTATFKEDKLNNEVQVNAFLQNIGVTNKQKVVWLQEK